MDNPDLTKLPIPKTWPNDGEAIRYSSFGYHKDPESVTTILECIDSQILDQNKQVFTGKYTNTQLTMLLKVQKIPVAICMGGPPRTNLLCNFSSTR